jgi:hypothetical protein
MIRPPDWAPLAPSDPLAGSPEEILEQAARLRDAVVELTWQVNTLKRIGVGQLVGAYAEALRVSGADVAANLEKVIHRYSETARCLSGWAPELEEFQTKTHQLLLQAQEVEQAALRATHDDPLQLAYRQLATGAVGNVPPELAPLIKQLHAVVEEAEARGRFWAHQISQAIDDGLTDHGWAHLHGWITNHKEQLEHYTKRLGYVATIAAVGALFVPGLNVAVLGMGAFGTLGALDAVALGSGLALLGTHSVMAAEGEGSWWEVGIDAVALGTFGYGRFVGRGIGRAAEVAKEAGAKATGEEAAQRFITMTREEAAQTMANPLATSGDIADANSALFTLDKDAARFGQDAAQAAREAPEPEAGLLSRLHAGSKEDADAFKLARQVEAEHPGNQAVQDAAGEVRRLAAKGRKNWAVAAWVDGSDKALNKYWAGSYGNFKEQRIFTHGIGWLE